jgi:hypothetical protein
MDEGGATRHMRSRGIVAAIVAVVGVAIVLLGLVHLAALPLVQEANRSGGINLPSIEDTGFRIQLNREMVLYGLLLVGVDRLAFGVILLLCVPALKKGRRLAWRIGVVIGSLIVVGYTPLVWVLFEGVHWQPLVMPALGLVIVVPLWIGHRGFTSE